MGTNDWVITTVVLFAPLIALQVLRLPMRIVGAERRQTIAHGVSHGSIAKWLSPGGAKE